MQSVAWLAALRSLKVLSLHFEDPTTLQDCAHFPPGGWGHGMKKGRHAGGALPAGVLQAAGSGPDGCFCLCRALAWHAAHASAASQVAPPPPAACLQALAGLEALRLHAVGPYTLDQLPTGLSKLRRLRQLAVPGLVVTDAPDGEPHPLALLGALTALEVGAQPARASQPASLSPRPRCWAAWEYAIFTTIQRGPSFLCRDSICRGACCQACLRS